MRGLFRSSLFAVRATPSPQLPVPAVPGRVVLPRWMLLETYRAFVPYWQTGVETAMFWAGPDHGDQAAITTMVQPALFQTAGNYHIPPEARAQMARRLRAQHLVVHAQVHTHPDRWVGHSRYDDVHAYSTAEGSLSVVWPAYGQNCSQDLGGLGLHVRRQGRWVHLESPAERAALLQVVDDRIDLRFTLQAGGIDDDE